LKLTDPNKYIVLGGRIRYLAGRNVGDSIIGSNLIWQNLQWLKRDLEELEFRVSFNLFERKFKQLEDDFTELSEIDDLDKNSNKLTKEQRDDLFKSIIAIEDTVFSEGKEHVIASPTPRRFSLDHLLNNPDLILGKEVFNSLTDIAKYDLKSCCKNLAFESPTSAAFHILRCIEECVRMLYRAYFPRKESSRPWGPLERELIDKPKKPQPESILLEHLTHLRKRFRNPTDHPEKIYEIEEAEDLVHMAVDVINRIARDKKIKV